MLKVILIVSLIGAVKAGCLYSSWWYSFDSKGQSMCDQTDHYIRGLNRNNLYDDDDLRYLEGVSCCSPPSRWSKTDVHVVYEDWTQQLDSENVWAHCPSGYFLQGLYRSDTGWPWYSGYLHNLETARCAKPATHPFYYGDCYTLDIPSFERIGQVSCRDGYYITGLYKSDGDELHYIDKLRCCAMANDTQVINSIGVFKNHIMEATLVNMAKLANMLGYGWCGGERGVNVGEDFERFGDIWVASTKLFWPSTSCDGYKCDERLGIVYDNWDFEVKEIKYGKRVTDVLEIESIDSGTIYNNHDTETTESIEKSQNVEETITHTTTNSWSNSHEVEISLNFQIPYIGLGTTLSYSTRYERSSSTTNEKQTMTSTTLSRSSTKTLPPFSSAKYKVMLSKTRTTIPYTAVVIAKFSTMFVGFLRWGQGYASPTTNYHNEHKGSGKRPIIPHKFGDSDIPFYRALKEQVDAQSVPWLWNEMLNNYPSGRHLINRLTDKTQYEITLSGTLEHVRGTKIDFLWEKVNRRRRDLNDGNVPTPNISKNVTIFAIPGPNDQPVKVDFPKVSLVSAEPFKHETIRVDKDSV